MHYLRVAMPLVKKPSTEADQEIFEVHSDLSACCAHKDWAGTVESAEVFIRKNFKTTTTKPCPFALSRTGVEPWPLDLQCSVYSQATATNSLHSDDRLEGKKTGIFLYSPDVDFVLRYVRVSPDVAKDTPSPLFPQFSFKSYLKAFLFRNAYR